MLQKNEEKCSVKLLTFVNPQEMQKWIMTIKRIVKTLKRNPNDDFDTDYVDVDSLLNMYMESFRMFKKKQ